MFLVYWCVAVAVKRCGCFIAVSFAGVGTVVPPVPFNPSRVEVL